jgi:hypothetical protein
MPANARKKDLRQQQFFNSSELTTTRHAGRQVPTRGKGSALNSVGEETWVEKRNQYHKTQQPTVREIIESASISDSREAGSESQTKSRIFNL